MKRDNHTRRDGGHRLVSTLKRAVMLVAILGLALLAANVEEAEAVFAPKNQRRSIAVPKKIRASSAFGFRNDPIDKRRDFHKGIDISRPAGAKVFAWSTGTVVKAGWMKDYGQTVDILHSEGIKTRYAHLRFVNVRHGQQVLAGEILGQVGRTGRTTGANLHFEMSIEDKLVDPGDHLSDVTMLVGNTSDADG